MEITPAKQFSNVVDTLPRRERELIRHCIDGNTLEEFARLYPQARSVILSVMDDEKPILNDVYETVEGWAHAAKVYSESQIRLDLGLRELPAFLFVGFSDASKFRTVQTGIQNYLEAKGELKNLVGRADSATGKILVHEPPKTKAVDYMGVVLHAQDLRLRGSAPGVDIMTALEESKLQGSFPSLHFVMPWSTLNVARAQATSPEEFVRATQFYVAKVPKEMALESYGPSLLRDAFRVLTGQVRFENLRSYNGPLTLHKD